VVFSLFRRKNKDKGRQAQRPEKPVVGDPGGPALAVVEREGGSPTDSIEARREAARLTEEKINRIESEMISATVTRPASSVADLLAPTTVAPVPVAVVAPPTRPVTDWFEGSSVGALGHPSAVLAIDINASSLPGALEEAAILFANGQPDPAAASLRQALAEADLGSFQQLAWLMLLDLHQSTGDKPAFEALALDYAARFESSPPAWVDAEAGDAGTDPRQAASSVALPARLDDTIASRVDVIERGIERRREITIDAGPVQSVDAAGAARLLALLRRVEKLPGRHVLTIRGSRRLFEAAQAAIEPGRRDDSDACWMLALFALRLLGDVQAFEDLGIEYCVTFEVSPPSWEPLPASIRPVPAAGDAGPAGGAAEVSGSPPAEPNAFVLAGEISGRMEQEMQALRSFAAGRSDVVVDCRPLRRIEFVAAGELLNEVVNLRSAGKQVLFAEPNRLVYALMLVMGIQELAEVRRRKI